MAFSFNSTQPAPQQPSAFGTPSFGAPPASSTSFSFGASTSTPSAATFPTFGTATAPPPATGFQLGSFSSGQTATTSTATNFGLGLNANVITTSSSSGPSVGLGGINSTPFGGDLTSSSSQGKLETKAFNEMAVPAEIAQSVEEFKKHVKEQKGKKDEVSRGSSKAPEKVGEEVETLKNILSGLANNIQQHSVLVHKLKHDVAIEIKNAEIGQRTKETAPSMQLDNTAPLHYFMHLVSEFEQRMQFYKQQIEDTERNLLAISKQHALTPQELMGTMKKLHEAFVLLAGRVHNIHTSLQHYKDDYLTYRRRVLADPTDIFANSKHGAGTQTKSMNVSVNQLNRIGSGPSPFGGTSDPLSRTLNHLTSHSVQISANSGGGGTNFANNSGLLANNNPAAGLSFATPGRPSGFFGNSTQTMTSSNQFQLQSPPPGNKRNKR